VPEEGGWLGSGPDYGPPARLIEPTMQPLPPRRFADGDLQPARRATLVVFLIAVAVLAVAGTAVLMLVNDHGAPPAAATTPSPRTTTPSASPTILITPGSVGAPRAVRIVDRGTSVTVTWADPSRGTVPFLVVGSGPGGEQLETKQVERGGTTVTYSGLERDRNYCFVVGAVYAVDRVATANQICTRR
jgi:hypothetical protein